MAIADRHSRSGTASARFVGKMLQVRDEAGALRGAGTRVSVWVVAVAAVKPAG